MSTPAPAAIGMPVEEVDTPCLLVDLDAFERNVVTLARLVRAAGVRLRAHAKTHKSVDIARYQIEHGGALGACCQKVSEAEALAAGGIGNILVSNEVVAPSKIDRLARLARDVRVSVCVDDLKNIDDLSAAATRHGSTLECLVEIEVGQGRCGVEPGAQAVELARKIATLPGLVFGGVQAYQGAAQHIEDWGQRKQTVDFAIREAERTVEALRAAGLSCPLVTGAGTGTFEMEAASGVYNELQCGSYIFMDAAYQRVRDESGRGLSAFGNSLFIYTAIMSKTHAGKAICDAGLKSISVDSGLPTVFGRADLSYAKCSDEHGVIADPGDALKLNDRLMLVPGHCDPTVNLHDWFVCIRKGRVEALWPVTARGLSY